MANNINIINSKDVGMYTKDTNCEALRNLNKYMFGISL